MNKQILTNIIDICSKQESVKKDVLLNHDNNLWWPLSITDYRMRLVIAGLSTRISYNMIQTYRNVITTLSRYQYEDIVSMDKDQLINIIQKLGLPNTRYNYMQSMIKFINSNSEYFWQKENDFLISEIANNVYGASYKVAQCCVLYCKGYYCGVMPVDSGMKDILLPCIGFEKRNSSIAHDILRKQLENTVQGINFKNIIFNNGYGQLNIKDYTNATWWVHLVLIYYKRNFCNKHIGKKCPLHINSYCSICYCEN